MRSSKWCTISVVVALLALNLVVPQCEARGGRGRGGGSFGGIFGGWRKYKKPTSNSNSRRTTNGSPMHTTITKSMSSGSNSGASYTPFSNTKQQSKPQASYPKQQLPYGGYGYPNYGSYYGSGGVGAAHLPPGSTYYPNTAAMPQGAIYYAQSPQRSGMGDFLVGMMAGHMLFGPRHHVTHVYGNPPEQSSQNNAKVIVVNNGEAATLNETAATQTAAGVPLWPTDSDTPLEPFNSTVTTADAMQPGKEPLFQRVNFNNSQTTQMTQAAATSAAPPVNGIICMPVVLNETDPSEPSKTLQVERILCFPAPPPPSEALVEPANANCMTRTFIEADPNDPSRSIEVTKELCTTTTTTLEPPQVAGEIGEVVASKAEKVTTARGEANEAAAEQKEELVTSTEGKFIRSLTTKNTA